MDLAGNKVIMNPIVSDEPSYELNALENTEVFPACAIIRTMRIKLEGKETLLQDGRTATGELELKDTFLLMSMITFYMTIGLVIL